MSKTKKLLVTGVLMITVLGTVIVGKNIVLGGTKDNPFFLPRGTSDFYCHVVRVVDGDTVKLRVRSWRDTERLVTMRLLGVNTPELHPRKGTADERTREKQRALLAKKFVETTLMNKVLFFRYSWKCDSFGRELGDLAWYDIDDSEHLLTKELLKKKYAVVFRR